MNKTNSPNGTATPDSSTTTLSTSLIQTGNYALAMELFAKNPNTEICVETPDKSFNIIPLANNQALFIPSTSTVFDNCVSIKETKNEYRFGPYDLYTPESQNTFADFFQNLLSDDNILSPKDTLNKTAGVQYEYSIEKTAINQLIENDNSIEFEELITGITELLENHPVIQKYNEESRDITPYDIILILDDLIAHNISLEYAIYSLNSWSDSEFNEIVLSKNKYKVFKKYE